MTADIELLPLPEGELAGEMRWGAQVYGRDEMHAYARACVAHATAAKDAEIEALLAEVERLWEIMRPKREKECLTLDHWRMRAYYLEANWSRCSHACAVEQTKREVERLTFEMERQQQQQQYDERTACLIVHRGAALACSAAVRAAYSEEHERAERLAEALREATDDLERGIDARIVVAQLRAALATQPGGDQPPRGCVMEDRKPRPATAWGIYNLGHLMDVAHLRKDAIAKCERLVGEPWSKCRKYMEVHKVRVTPKGASHE